jgi:hypothetical protein
MKIAHVTSTITDHMMPRHAMSHLILRNSPVILRTPFFRGNSPKTEFQAFGALHTLYNQGKFPPPPHLPLNSIIIRIGGNSVQIFF